MSSHRTQLQPGILIPGVGLHSCCLTPSIVVRAPQAVEPLRAGAGGLGPVPLAAHTGRYWCVGSGLCGRAAVVGPLRRVRGQTMGLLPWGVEEVVCGHGSDPRTFRSGDLTAAGHHLALRAGRICVRRAHGWQSPESCRDRGRRRGPGRRTASPSGPAGCCGRACAGRLSRPWAVRSPERS